MTGTRVCTYVRHHRRHVPSTSAHESWVCDVFYKISKIHPHIWIKFQCHTFCVVQIDASNESSRQIRWYNARCFECLRHHLMSMMIPLSIRWYVYSSIYPLPVSFHLFCSVEFINCRVQKGLKSSAYRDREGRYAPAMEGGTYMACTVPTVRKDCNLFPKCFRLILIDFSVSCRCYSDRVLLSPSRLQTSLLRFHLHEMKKMKNVHLGDN